MVPFFSRMHIFKKEIINRKIGDILKRYPWNT